MHFLVDFEAREGREGKFVVVEEELCTLWTVEIGKFPTFKELYEGLL